MVKYCFRVYTYDGDILDVIPTPLKDQNVGLAELDRFVYKSGSYRELCNLLANDLQIESEKIEKVKILQLKKKIEFSIILKNPYLTPVLDTIKSKKVVGYKSYDMDTKVVSSDNDSYISMKNYLFEAISNNYDQFFNEIYKYDNDFSKLLRRYAILYNLNSNSEEELRTLSELKDKISTGLRIYKNYRGLCKARYDYENKYFLSRNKSFNSKKTSISLKSNPLEYDDTKHPKQPIYEVNNYVNDLGEEREEFLEEDELESVDDYGYGKRR